MNVSPIKDEINARTMQGDYQSTSSSSTTPDSPPRPKVKAKENLYRKFFKTSTGSKVLRQGQSPSAHGDNQDNGGKENANMFCMSSPRSNKTTRAQDVASKSTGETLNCQLSSASSTFPILSGRQIYPQTQKVEKARLVKVS